ncbi:MAG: N-acetylmuramoyl-L-alanine amidase [Clostridia bacterium]|nr:N-acetylmuramoyl-L-alanine amidase [Clostridia bacterium]
MCINKLVVWILVAVSMVGVLAIPTVLSSVNRDVKTVVIDPGHGGLDSGVSSENGVKESDVVLLIARVLGEYLESGGFNVVLTRKNQSALIGGRFVKKTDMERRVEIIKKASPQLVISIHLNSFSDKRRKGMQVFFGGDNSRDFALLTQDILNQQFNLPDAGRNFSILKADKYILNESPCPAVIIECGFLSNNEDERNLLDDTYRHRLAESIYQSILLWSFGEGA